MPRKENQKSKPLLLARYLYTETDEFHPAPMAQLLAELARCGVPAERKSVYADLDCLRSLGFAVERDGRGYWLGARTFELAELKLLVDAVQASRFISEKKTRQLIGKLQTLCSRHEAADLKRQVVIAGRAKSGGESLYYNVDLIQRAIAGDRIVRFRYFDWALDGSRRYREGDRSCAPIALCWEGEFYYLIAETVEHGLTHYRVDKMTGVTITQLPRRLSEQAQNLDLAAYSQRTFGMFTGREQTVRLRFHNSLAGVVIDRFGAGSMLIPDGAQHFTFTTVCAVSPLFFSWLAMFSARAEILDPPAVREAYRTMLCEALQPWEDEKSGLDNNSNSYYNEDTNSY